MRALVIVTRCSGEMAGSVSMLARAWKSWVCAESTAPVCASRPVPREAVAEAVAAGAR